MRKKAVMGITAVVLLLALVLTGCEDLLGLGKDEKTESPPLQDKQAVATVGDTDYTFTFAAETVVINGTSYAYTAKDGVITITDPDWTMGTIEYAVRSDGSIRITKLNGEIPEETIDDIPDNPVDIPESVQDLITAGTNSLLAENFDAALVSFEKAYVKDAAAPKAVIYSSLGKLASIAKDAKFKKLLEDRLGVKNYPGTIDSLVTGDWFTEYPDERLVWDYRDEEDRSVYWYGDAPQSMGLSNSGSWMPEGITEPGYYYYDGWEDIKVDAPPQYTEAPRTSFFVYDEEGTSLHYVYWRDDQETPGYYYVDNGEFVLYSEVQQYQIRWSYYDDEIDRSLQWRWNEGFSEGSYETDGAYYYQKSKYTLVSAEPKYTTEYLRVPGIEAPEWFKGTELYTDSLTVSTTARMESAATWNILIYAGLLDKNTNGLNDLLDGVLDSVFGTAFEEAATRIGTLAYADSVELEAAVVSQFGLEEMLEGDKIYIGRAELDLLIAAMRVVKASLEWLSSYDWNTDLSFLRTDWRSADGLVANLNAMDVSTLPLKNNFLKDRGNGAMAKAKADYIKALDAAINAYDHIGEKGPQIVKDTLAEYAGIKTGLEQLKAAIDSGAVFYIPAENPLGSTWPETTEANALFGINMGAFFTAGHFSLDKLIENNAGTPVFYGWNFSDDQDFDDAGSGEVVTAESLAGYDAIGLKLTLAPFSTLITGIEVPESMPFSFPVELGKILYNKYNGTAP